jgi:hypothetical protein
MTSPRNNWAQLSYLCDGVKPACSGVQHGRSTMQPTATRSIGCWTGSRLRSLSCSRSGARSPNLPPTAVAPAPGLPRFTIVTAPLARPINTPPGFSLAPGYVSSGAAGKTARLTIPPTTVALNASPTQQLDIEHLTQGYSSEMSCLVGSPLQLRTTSVLSQKFA